MEFTQADVDAGKAKLAGLMIKRLRFGDRDIENASVADAEKLIAIMERDVSAASGKRRFSLAGFTRQS